MIKFEEIVEEFKVNFDSVVEVNDGGYELGFEQGIEHAKSTLTEKEITANGEYVPQDSLGFNKVIVNVPDINGSYDNGFADGQLDGYNNALEKLTELEVNGNGEYLPSGESIGFKKVVATGYLDTTDATATPEKILDGFTAYVKDEKIEGTIPKYNGESENAEIKTSKLASLVDGTITEVTEKDLVGVTSIRNYAFYYAPITSVEIPDTVTSIGMFAFGYCSNLTSITIGSGVTSIGNQAFSNCSKLTSVVIGNSVTSIGNYAFSGCTSLTEVTIPDSVEVLGSDAFYYCSSLTSITIPNSVEVLGDSAFERCSKLTNLSIPASVTKIGSSALIIGSTNNKATIRMLPRTNGETPPTIQSSSFYTSTLQAIEIPENEISAYSSATQWSNLTSYFVPYQP